MATNKHDMGIEPAARSNSEDNRRRVKRGGREMLVYSEVSITVKVDPISNNFIKIVAGHERLSPSASDHDLKATFKDAERFNEAIVDRQAKRIQRIIRQIEEARE
jgi:hypothetical protein